MTDKPERQGQGWDIAEERQLYDAYVAGKEISEIAKVHQRGAGGIRAALKRLGLLDDDGQPVDPVPDFAPTDPAISRTDKQAMKDAVRTARPSTPSAMSLSPEMNERFQEALQLMDETDRHLFITGKAGTGKSTLLSYFCRNTDKDPVVLAPTGVAALNVKGQTIHSFFNFPVDVTIERIRSGKIKPKNTKLYKKLKMIVIDEVSMVRADLLDCIDMFLRLYGPRSLQAFGGVQMVFIGDLFQLPPVVKREERDIFASLYETPYFFSAHVMQACRFAIVELQKIYRQKDQAFVDLLNRVRNNTVSPADLTLINSRVSAQAVQNTDDFQITLTTTNATADAINETHLAALPGKLQRATGIVSGDFSKEYFPTAPDLMYKIGAQVMMLNNDSEKRWVNGSIGIIKAKGRDVDGSLYLSVDLQESGETVAVAPYTWEVFRFGLENDAITSESVGSFTQFPFRLAWGITIHKSQGKTFERVVIDTGRGAFAAGQIYVALSRCTSLEGITLINPIRARDISTDPRIIEFLSGRNSADEKAKIVLIDQAIRASRSMSVTYRKADDTEVTHDLQPLEIVSASYQGERYQGMRALMAGEDTPRLFRIDRILQIA